MQRDDSGSQQSARYQWNSTLVTTDSGEEEAKGDYVFLRNSFECNYPAGVDPIWGITNNKLQFVNVIKMKISVIMAIFHMSIGIIMKGTNAVYFKKPIDLITEVIFGLIILLGLFGWMDALIIAKWFHTVDIEDTGTDKVPPINANKLYYETEDDDQLAEGSNYILKYNGDYIN